MPAWGDIIASAVIPRPTSVSDGSRPVCFNTSSVSILQFSTLTVAWVLIDGET